MKPKLVLWKVRANGDESGEKENKEVAPRCMPAN
jgi:hypothetical protein